MPPSRDFRDDNTDFRGLGTLFLVEGAQLHGNYQGSAQMLAMADKCLTP